MEFQLTHAVKEIVKETIPVNINERHHPEHAAGGYANNDGTVEFYQRVVAVLPEGGVVLDLGAGRGAIFDEKDGSWRDWLVRLGQKHSRRIGADVDPVVKTNPELDKAEIIEPGKPLPFGDQSFDLILCDWVVEHVEDPESFVAEVRRVLKVGGWFCCRTPNRWSYFSIGARLFSGAGEDKALRILQPGRRAADVFPKFYTMNTLAEIRKQFASDHWINATYTHNPDPSYVGNSSVLYHLINLYQRLTPKVLRTVILIFARRIS
jgi:SAM-dependent methyltransferase